MTDSIWKHCTRRVAFSSTKQFRLLTTLSRRALEDIVGRGENADKRHNYPLFHYQVFYLGIFKFFQSHLTLYHTIPTLKIPLENIMGKAENAGHQ